MSFPRVLLLSAIAAALGCLSPAFADTTDGEAARPERLTLACSAKLARKRTRYRPRQQSSVQSTRQLLQLFGQACSAEFPDLAKAALQASHVGRPRRSQLLGKAAASFCPQAEAAKTAQDVIARCPPVDGDPTLSVWKHLDAGTYAFVQLLRAKGLSGVFLIDELILQASLHPERDE